MQNYKEKSNLESLLNGKYTDSHILNVNSITRFFQLILCIIFKYYPESPLGFGDQRSLNSQDENVQNAAINQVLDGMQAGDYYKLCAVERKYGMLWGGHSMLIYKANDDNFTFFDPNTGAQTCLDKAGIKQKVETSRAEWDHYFNSEVEIAIMDNKKFLAKHHSQFMSELNEVAAQNAAPVVAVSP